MTYIVKAPCDEAVIQAAPVHVSKELKRTMQAEQPTYQSQVGTWVLVATILGSSIAFIDGTVVNVALPVIRTDLNVTASDVQWVVEAYSLFLSALILVGGSLGDRFGRRRFFALGILIFTVASVLCGLVSNVNLLIVARAIQGIGGALLVPGSLSIISAAFDHEQRGRAIGTWSGYTAITSAIGPVIGGLLVQYASWRWVFFINAPVAVFVLIILFWRVPESRNEELDELIRVQGYSPTAAGAANLPLILLIFLLSRWSGGLVARYGAKLPLIVGPLIAALGFALFALPGIGGSYWTTFFPAAVVLGIGMAVSVAPLTTTVMGAVDTHYAGTASGINNAVSRIAGLIAIAVFGIIVLPVFSNSLSSQLPLLHVPLEIQQIILAQQDKLVGIEIPSGLNISMHAAVQQAISASFITSFRVIMLLAAILALCSSVSSLLLIEGKAEL